MGNVRTEELYRAYERLGVLAQRVTLIDDPSVSPCSSFLKMTTLRCD